MVPDHPGWRAGLSQGCSANNNVHGPASGAAGSVCWSYGVWLLNDHTAAAQAPARVEVPDRLIQDLSQASDAELSFSSWNILIQAAPCPAPQAGPAQHPHWTSAWHAHCMSSASLLDQLLASSLDQFSIPTGPALGMPTGPALGILAGPAQHPRWTSTQNPLWTSTRHPRWTVCPTQTFCIAPWARERAGGTKRVKYRTKIPHRLEL